MSSNNPFNAINLSGEGAMRGVTLALPVERVRNMLPAGLELGAQNVTPEGTHPVVLFFHDFFRAQLSVPTLLPSMTYHEHTVGIPFSYLSTGSITPGYPGPYYFMPKLYLDNILAVVGGVLFWGMNKHLGAFQVTGGHYCIRELDGQRLTALSWTTDPGALHRPAAEYAHFEPIRQILSQPLIMLVPAAVGPFFILSDFDKNWDVATVRPLHTIVDVDVEYILDYPAGRYPADGWSPGIAESVLGSYELRAPWRLGLPYPPVFSFR